MKVSLQSKSVLKELQFHFDLLFPEAKHYSDIPFSGHDCLLCWSAPARGSPVSFSMSPLGPQACCNLSEVREPEKAGVGGRGSIWLAGALDS